MKIKTSNWFLLILAFSVVSNGLKPFIFTLICCIVHEIGHILPIRLFGCKIQQLNLSLIGGSIKSFDMHKLSYIKQFVIYSNGIILNILFANLCNFIAMQGFHSRDFFMLSGINLLLAFFNALPIKILDGYNCFFCLLMIFTKKYNFALKSVNSLSFLINITIILLGLISVKYNNFSVISIGISLLFAQKIKLK